MIDDPIDTEGETATKAGLARVLGITRQAVHNLCKRRVIEFGADGLINVADARRVLVSRLSPDAKSSGGEPRPQVHRPPPAPPPAPVAEPVKPAPKPAPKPAAEVAPPKEAPPSPPASEEMDYFEARARDLAAKALIGELNLRKMKGELTEVSKVEGAIFTASRMLRDMVLNVPKRIAADAVATGDARLCERMMSDALRRCFNDFQQLAAAGVSNDEQLAAVALK